MKIKCFLPSLMLLAFFTFGKNAGAQTARSLVRLGEQQLNAARFQSTDYRVQLHGTGLLNLPLQPTGHFLAYSIIWFSNDWDEKDDQITIYFREDGQRLAPVTVHPDGHEEASGNRHVSELYFLEVPATHFQIQLAGPVQVDSLEIHFFDPGISSPQPQALNRQSPIPSPQSSITSACTCPQPAFQGRLDWCPDGTCPTDPTPEFVPNPTHVIIHHTAGTNVAADWAAVVRSIWDFHVNTNGWDDIGYNWLVDPNGVLYEGRGDGRLGAHFCGQNGNTTGICVMGDFTSIQPTAAAIEKLADFLAWETCDENIDPLGTSFHSGSGLTLMNISGHRDGCTTGCPGDMFYPLLPDVRQMTADNIADGCDADVLPAPTVLAVTFVGANKISLNWQDNSNTETAYSVERSVTTDDNFSQLVQLPANATAFSDNTVMPGNTYFYRVRAKQGAVFSDYSNVAVAITSPSATVAELHGGMAALAPNPTSGIATLSLENQWFGRTELTVFDALGSVVVQSFFEEKIGEQQVVTLDLSGAPAGLFWLKIVQGDAAGWVKLVKN